MTWLLDQMQTAIQTAAGFGSFVYVLVTRKMGWINVLTLFLVGQITAYYVTIPLAVWRGFTPSYYGVLGFSIGALAMLIWGAVINVAQSLHDDPKGTLTGFWRLWRGGNGQGGEKS
jgi:hypothetical protein